MVAREPWSLSRFGWPGMTRRIQAYAFPRGGFQFLPKRRRRPPAVGNGGPVADNKKSPTPVPPTCLRAIFFLFSCAAGWWGLAIPMCRGGFFKSRKGGPQPHHFGQRFLPERAHPFTRRLSEPPRNRATTPAPVQRRPPGGIRKSRWPQANLTNANGPPPPNSQPGRAGMPIARGWALCATQTKTPRRPNHQFVAKDGFPGAPAFVHKSRWLAPSHA